jgi:hypothetical protein
MGMGVGEGGGEGEHGNGGEGGGGGEGVGELASLPPLSLPNGLTLKKMASICTPSFFYLNFHFNLTCTTLNLLQSMSSIHHSQHYACPLLSLLLLTSDGQNNFMNLLNAAILH